MTKNVIFILITPKSMNLEKLNNITVICDFIKENVCFFVCFWLIIPDSGKRVQVYGLENRIYIIAILLLNFGERPRVS